MNLIQIKASTHYEYLIEDNLQNYAIRLDLIQRIDEEEYGDFEGKHIEIMYSNEDRDRTTLTFYMGGSIKDFLAKFSPLYGALND